MILTLTHALSQLVYFVFAIPLFCLPSFVTAGPIPVSEGAYRSGSTNHNDAKYASPKSWGVLTDLEDVHAKDAGDECEWQIDCREDGEQGGSLGLVLHDGRVLHSSATNNLCVEEIRTYLYSDRADDELDLVVQSG